MLVRLGKLPMLLPMEADKLLIIMVGSSCSGKTVVARVLELAGFMRFSWEATWQELQALAAADPEDAMLRDESLIPAFTIAAVEDAIRSQCRIVVDTPNLELLDRELLTEIAVRHSFVVVRILMDTSLETCVARMRVREGSQFDISAVQLLQEMHAILSSPDDCPRSSEGTWLVLKHSTEAAFTYEWRRNP